MRCSIAHNPVRKYCAHKAVIHQWWQPVESWDCDQQVSTLWRLSTAASFTGRQKYLLCFSDSTRKSIELSVHWRFICLTLQIQLSLCPVELSECGKTPERSSSIYFIPFHLSSLLSASFLLQGFICEVQLPVFIQRAYFGPCISEWETCGKVICIWPNTWMCM